MVLDIERRIDPLLSLIKDNFEFLNEETFNIEKTWVLCLKNQGILSFLFVDFWYYILFIFFSFECTKRMHE